MGYCKATCEGGYEFDSERILNNGYGNTNKSFEYQRQIPDDYPNVEVAGKTLTMYCYEGSGWYICVLNDESPRSEFDIDYYYSEDYGKFPPLSGWDECDAGELPVPTLTPVGICPEGEEFNTPEHQLAKWAIENKLVELALEDLVHSDIVDKSSELFSFLARMCDKFDWLYHNGSTTVDAKFCLDMSHIRLIGEACATTTDVQVLEKLSAMMMYHLESSLPEQLKELVTPMRKTAAERRIQLNDPTMKDLMIGGSFYADDNEECVYIPSDEKDLKVLFHNVGANNHLKTLRFDGTVSTLFGNMELESREAFLSNLKNNSSISLLQLCECNVTESLGAGVLKSFGDRLSKLTELTISDCNFGGGGGAVVFVLRKCRHLKKVNLIRNGIDNAILADIVTSFQCQRELENICLTDNIIEGVAGCNTLVHLLQDNAMSNLATLRLDRNLIDDDGLLALAAGLYNNVKLKRLELFGIDITESVFSDAFSQVLCDTSSVNSTYLSNHTLQFVRIDWETYPFSAYLEMNAASDKSRVAIKKILRHHSNIDMMPFFEWELKALPIATRWFDKAIGFAATSQSISMEEDDDEDDSTPESREEVVNIETEKLSAIYQFVTAMPMFFVPTAATILPLKRKQCTLT